ncbi:putative holin-like toxin [Heyndrickxia sporothermodurans]|nr:putative holin-like toxin [Heyndrickxia sporothermodurans]
MITVKDTLELMISFASLILTVIVVVISLQKKK